MTKRKELTKKIAQAAKAAGIPWEVEREGGNHTIYRLGDQKVTIGRHNELGNRYAETVYKQCEQTLGEDWWR
ncbi:MAG: hypothetical protein QM774_12930 [Gordonia sp. (in: high G+C Gram-positive bacteria)]|uniref:hypothetical protein n=1 Tax=Gordonia sp. (in: high G+C Gram-positive bacteria) TaxID=84139 RepID=UPI0039E5E048